MKSFFSLVLSESDFIQLNDEYEFGDRTSWGINKGRKDHQGFDSNWSSELNFWSRMSLFIGFISSYPSPESNGIQFEKNTYYSELHKPHLCNRVKRSKDWNKIHDLLNCKVSS